MARPRARARFRTHAADPDAEEAMALELIEKARFQTLRCARSMCVQFDGGLFLSPGAERA